MGAVGFIGLGIMGHSMARNLMNAGHDVTVWNRTVSRADDLAEAGARLAGSPAEVARLNEIVMICVSDTPDVEAVVFGPNGVAEGIRSGALIIDHSTISPAATKEMARRINALDGSWLDAPISGGAEGAAKGTLSIMIGGDAADIERARQYLDAVGATITHVGTQGAGQLVKAVNQILVVVNQLGVSEALLLAEAGGLDLEATLAAVEGGAAGSWMLSNRGPQMIRRDWRPGFTIDLQQKDLRLVLEAADELGVPLPGTALVFQLYRALQNRDLGSEGNHALIKALEEMSGIRLGSHD
ncbi:MAG: NAD(P)-dependent oxidoreductase [Acidimicrobiia bacterium]|nr:NAD(P)-dependent oxidoreductase [Acidimicrobiia bacterium]